MLLDLAGDKPHLDARTESRHQQGTTERHLSVWGGTGRTTTGRDGAAVAFSADKVHLGRSEQERLEA